MILQIQKYLTKRKKNLLLVVVQLYDLFFPSLLVPFLDLSTIQRNNVIFNGSNYEQSLLHILENMVPEAVSDAEVILYTMICCRRIMRWDGRRRLIVDGHTLPGMDLAELLEYAVLPYHKISLNLEVQTVLLRDLLVLELNQDT